MKRSRPSPEERRQRRLQQGREAAARYRARKHASAPLLAAIRVFWALPPAEVSL